MVGGKFDMGSTYHPDSQPVHAVEVKAFCLDRTEVTTQMYEACVAQGACTKPKGKHAYCNAGKADRADHPINCVDWNQANAYCEAQKRRLPTEEEWEYAARGPEGKIFPWGNQLDGTALCWNGGPTGGHGTKKGDHTCPVGTFPRDVTGAGVMDMAGNVQEWTSSWNCPYEPGKPCAKQYKILRGGSWFYNTEAFIRLPTRSSYAPKEESYFVGFRCAADMR